MLIIGYGNVLRSDDAAGICAARELKRLGFEAIAVHQLTPELAERMAGMETVVFIDADATLAPGGVRVSVVPPADEAHRWEHQATPAGLLQICCDVYECVPVAFLVGIGGESFQLGNGISEAAMRGVRKAVALLRTAGFERIAGGDISGLQASSKPRDALLGGSMRERLRADAASG